jgi:hypothetical protein
MAAGKCRDLVAIAAASHGAPAAATRARHVGEEEAAARISTEAETSGRPLDENLRGRPRDGGKQPLEAAFPGKELQSPLSAIPNQFVMPFGDAQDFVYRFKPVPGNLILSNHGAENLAKCFLQSRRAGEQVVGSLWVTLGKGEKLRASLWRNYASGFEESDETFPAWRTRESGGVGKIDGQAAAEEQQFRPDRYRASLLKARSFESNLITG